MAEFANYYSREKDFGGFLPGAIDFFFSCGDGPSQDSTSGTDPVKEIPISETSDTSIRDNFMEGSQPLSYRFPYDLLNSDDKIKLPSNLKEISGLGVISQNKIALIQDEKGNIYIFDIEKEEIKKKVDFWKGGDYEGVEVVGNTAWVLRSDGTIVEIPNYSGGDPEKIKHKTFLDEACDAEGLGYDPGSNRLLIACKGFPGKGKKLMDKKALYEFPLDSKKMNKKPAYVIDPSIFKTTEEIPIQEAYQKAEEFINPGKGDKTFQPSGVAVHPVSGNIYVIASVGKRLAVLDQRGKLVHDALLDKDLFKQPEGITFLPDATLLISNEGRGGKANILKFKPKK